MSRTNSKLAFLINNKAVKTPLVESSNIPAPNTTNIQGYSAYKLEPFFKLLSMLNTLKLEPQYYRTQQKIVKDLDSLIATCAKKDVYLTCQCIVYSRCLGTGMRTISHLAAVLVAKYISGEEYAKNFYSSFNRETKTGGLIYRPDDMSEMLDIWTIFHNMGDGKNLAIPNSMKKGFAKALQELDTYSLLKYKNKLIDVINIVHPNPNFSQAFVKHNGKNIPTLSAIMSGAKVSANTWEVNQSEAGQIVAQAVRDCKITNVEAQEILVEAKADNWKELLDTNKLGILAALRNIRNILENKPKKDTVEKLCALLSNGELIKKGKIMPYQIDIANTIIQNLPLSENERKVLTALEKGLELSIPNLKEVFTGRNLVIIDMSGSMSFSCVVLGRSRTSVSCSRKASLLGAIIAKATNADVIVFGSTAKYLQYNPTESVFSLALKWNYPTMGGTDLSVAWNLASQKEYDRVFILSDNECNIGNTYDSYKNYVEKAGNPYVYTIDLASYGTTMLAGPKVKYFYGYGLEMFEDIINSEFNPEHHISKVKEIKI